MSVLEQANENFRQKYGMTPDECRKKFLTENKLTFDKIAKMSKDEQLKIVASYETLKEKILKNKV